MDNFNEISEKDEPGEVISAIQSILERVCVIWIGIANCIHTYAGVQLRAECSRRMEQLRLRYGKDYVQPTAVPILTDAFNLPAKKVIHIVGPVVSRDLTPELEEELASCYRNTLDLCLENGLKSVAFCCIPTGVFHFPNREAAEIAVRRKSGSVCIDGDIGSVLSSL